MAGQLLHQEGAAAEFHNHSNRISTKAAVAAAAAVARAASFCSSSRQPHSGDLRHSSQVPWTLWSAHGRCQCWLLEKVRRRERDQSWNWALGGERERAREPCSGRQVGENALGSPAVKLSPLWQ